MKGWVITLIIVAVIAIIGGWYIASRPDASHIPADNILNNSAGSSTSSSSDNTSLPLPSSSSSSTTSSSTGTSTSSVRVTTPKTNSVVTSSVTVTGDARGTWYFEASFPVKVVDANGTVLGQAPAQAQGDWMTSNYVPFKAVVSFTPSTTATGFIILEKDNPSGLPQNASQVMVPIRFR